MFPTKEKIQPLGTNNLLKHLLAAKFKKKNNKGIFTYDCFERKKQMSKKISHMPCNKLYVIARPAAIELNCLTL